MTKKRRLPQVRQCGTCRACCTTQRVNDMVEAPTLEKAALLESLIDYDKDTLRLVKPADVPCPHLAENINAKGCTIYSTRPKACADWKCAWLSSPNTLTGAERPDRLGIVLDVRRKEGVPFSFIVAVSAFAEEAKRWFESAMPTIKRLVSEGHLVVCEYPDGYQDVYGPESKVRMYDSSNQETRERPFGAARG